MSWRDTYRGLRRAEGLYSIIRNGDEALWARAKIRKADRFQCGSCETPFAIGDEAYHSIGNQMYRADRLCRSCVEGD